ncbi:Gfo/Idh/MocA family protein [Ruania halotolerans]|uniref:Gfo/Idh/MocA family protein n=1 Tax=Ruania halotolerans TaxID=2897773 RepID=UPI001E5DE8BF|nr:Gfo/Idh/MocA family oxidoreductase [Ruania halotolerans]UFU06903.1 Gfo/Idh/MocA family oxidoreductase [Ruania halotolerans]
MTRIGFIGTENSHTDHFIRFLNDEIRHPGVSAVALCGGRTERNLALAKAGGIEIIVDEPADLLGVIDAAIISTRDGARHREQAEPLLEAGLPVLVDKPLATTVPDAEAIFAAAAASGVPVYSASALRFVPQVAELVKDGAGAGALRSLHIVGPGDPDSPYSGLFFYGIHHVETALEMLGNPVVAAGNVPATVRRSGDTTTALLRVANVDLTLTFVAPTENERVPFHATAVHTHGVLTRTLVLEKDYNAPALAAFVQAIATGVAPASNETLIAPVAVLSAVVDALPGQVRS